MTNGLPRGLTASVTRNVKVRLPATRGLAHWSNVTDYQIAAPGGTWNTLLPLENYGDCYRLQLLAL